MGKLIYGTHEGTPETRDLSGPIECRSLREAKEKIEDIEGILKISPSGLKIWFAHYFDDSKTDPKRFHEIHEGTPYS
jgi:hypothetical protein